jgi:sugar phosphate isomerase/epimerase
MIRIGNASAPRWHGLSLDRLDSYIDQLVEWGATATELVLHTGESDESVRRVHHTEDDWFPAFERYRANGLICHAHAPLHPRFKLDRWTSDAAGLRRDLQPVVHAAATFSDRQGQPCVLVFHGAGGSHAQDATAGFLEWAAGELGSGLLSLELRAPRPGTLPGFDRERGTLVDFVEKAANGALGICWDVAHDWEGANLGSDRVPVPEEQFTRFVNHVHLHNIGGVDHQSHFPLQQGDVPWQEMLAPLVGSGYSGTITMEIRYRCALALGDPWQVLGESYALLDAYLGQVGTNRSGETLSTSPSG